MDPLLRLCELDNIPVEVSKAGTAAPRFTSGRMKNDCASCLRSRVRRIEVIDAEAHLCSRSPLALALVEREVKERPVGPGDGGVAAADPTIVGAVVASLVIGEVQVKSEAVSVERYS